MKMLVAQRPLLAALVLISPLAAAAQTTMTNQRPSLPENASRSVDRLTLLRGPGLLSSATGETSLVKEHSTQGSTFPRELEDARRMVGERQEKLKRLQAERDVLLARRKQLEERQSKSVQQELELKQLEGALPAAPRIPSAADAIRFDGEMPSVPTKLVPKPGESPTGTLKLVPAEKK